MSKVAFRIAISLDGFAAGPDQSVDNPIGIGGMHLHDWVFPLKVWRESHGMEGGEVNESTPVIAEAIANTGATIMGRKMFGGPAGEWDTANPWNGWWGDEPPFRHPVFVLTHHPREPLVLGETTFHFVTEGIEAALEQARAAAGDKDISVAGGASTGAQYLAAGLIDEMTLNVAPILLGSGERLFNGVGTDLHGLELVRTVAAPGVTHLTFRR